MKKTHVKQHVVPQSYLKRFAVKNTNNKGFHIGVRRVVGNKVTLYSQAVDKIAYVENFYDVETREDPKHWERYFATNIEPLYGTPLNNVISKITMTANEKSVFDADDKQILSKIICFQMIRVPAFLNRQIRKSREIEREIRDYLIKTIGSSIAEKQKEWLAKASIEDSWIKDTLFEAISDSDRLNRFAELMEGRIWTVDYNNTEIPFVTSDNPVIMFNYLSESTDHANTGIGRPDTVIMFPLSSRLMIQVFPKELWGVSVRKLDGQRIVLTNKDIQFVIKVNIMQMEHCSFESYMDPEYFERVKNAGD